MSKLLIDEPPLQVLPSLAEEIGLNEAILLQQLHYWLQRSENEEPDQDGIERVWAWKTLDEWEQEMPFWSKSTIRRTLRSLKDEGVLIAEKKRKDVGDMTVWYTVDYDGLQRSVQNEQMGCSKRTNGMSKMNTSAPAHNAGTRSETTTESNNNSAGAREKESVQAYEEIFPRRLKQSQAEKVAHKVDDMDLWRAVLEWWDMNGYRAKSVGRMLNKYRQTDSPDDLYQDRKNGHTQTSAADHDIQTGFHS